MYEHVGVTLLRLSCVDIIYHVCKKEKKITSY